MSRMIAGSLWLGGAVGALMESLVGFCSAVLSAVVLRTEGTGRFCSFAV